MATHAQLKQHRQNQVEFGQRVDEAKKQQDETLLLAQAQFAILATSEERRAIPTNVTERDGFRPNAPRESLNEAELANLDGATVAVVALAKYVNLGERLSHRTPPIGTYSGSI